MVKSSERYVFPPADHSSAILPGGTPANVSMVQLCADQATNAIVRLLSMVPVAITAPGTAAATIPTQGSLTGKPPITGTTRSQWRMRVRNACANFLGVNTFAIAGAITPDLIRVPTS